MKKNLIILMAAGMTLTLGSCSLFNPPAQPAVPEIPERM